MRTVSRVALTSVAVVLLGLLPASVSGGALRPSSITIDVSAEAPIVTDDYEAAMEALDKLIIETGALGTYLDEDGTVVVVVPSSRSSAFSRFDGARLGVDVAIESRNIELAEIHAIKDYIESGKAVVAGKDYSFGAPFDARIGKVRLVTNAPKSAFRELFRQFPGKILYDFRKNLSRTRHWDVEPHWGGTQMHVIGSSYSFNCTAAFAVVTSALKDRMLTAAHCFFLGETIESPYHDDLFGVVKRRDNFPANDFELIGDDGIDMGKSIIIGDTEGVKAPVYGAGTIVSNTAYCYSGAATGEHCAQYLFDVSAWCGGMPYGCTTNARWFHGRFSPCDGDSGAPMYRFLTGEPGLVDSHVKVVGVEFAGACEAATTDTVTVAEDYSKIQTEYGVTAKTH
jgi:hypothetical protein